MSTPTNVVDLNAARARRASRAPSGPRAQAVAVAHAHAHPAPSGLNLRHPSVLGSASDLRAARAACDLAAREHREAWGSDGEPGPLAAERNAALLVAERAQEDAEEKLTTWVRAWNRGASEEEVRAAVAHLTA